ncbi:chemotaxis protein CheA [Altererythrobacter lutimaris]|uniref:Chemotaxis protein CheA n=1 Tax=Altererythrobacter lutimaris TaxID=2743979 RepID=A0A850HCT7_9SPHN|nr:chemotaxis protein CheA [Altererythrobacter lutimaris]NVE94871.1 chemotaxis protein CheA [Altererythrobacter lutimaris]
MDDLLADFVAETREMLEASQGELVAWEADPSDRSRLDAVFRFVHTVKGNCGFFDFPRLEMLSHAAEDALADVRAGRRESDTALVTAILAIIDRIAQMADAIEAGNEFPEGGDEELIAALEASERETGTLADAPAKASPNSEFQSDKSAVAKSAPLAGAGSQARTIRLSTALLDRVMVGVSDMVLARNDLAHRLRIAGNEPTIDGPFERLSSILTDVREAITRMRMQHIEHLFSVFPRLVRDLSNELGKQVLIDFEGGDVELDREMVEMVRDPLTHIVRNAVDHGIEPPAERLKTGKRETGLLRIAARQAGNRISIVITDDGRGLDVDKIAAKALENGLVTKASLAEMNREDILQLVFEPGLTTAEHVSSVSGRGVGLDVVRANLERVGGTIRVTSTPDHGSLFYLTLPLTLSIISGLTVEQGDQCFAIPQSYVEEVVQLDSDALDYTQVGDRPMVTFREKRVPCLSMEDILGVSHKHETEDRTAIMIRLASGDLIALLTDKVRNISDLVVKPLPPAIMQTRLYTGSTQLDDGTPILVLDVPQIASNAGLISDTHAQSSGQVQEEKEAVSRGTQAMIFIGYDNRRYAMRLELIERIETVAREALDLSGKRPRVLVNGILLDLLGFDAADVPSDTLRLLRMSDGINTLAYAVKRVEDAVFLSDELNHAPDEDLLEGLAILDGKPVALLDGYAIFARYGTACASGAQITCSVPDTEWAKSILAPLVARCGYAVLPTSSDETADVEIVMSGEAPTRATHANTIVLADIEPGESDEKPGSIYRYDEMALRKALQEIRMRNTKGEAA